MGILRKKHPYNLKLLLEELVATQLGIEEIYLFGSRAYNTGSLRSDCDLLVKIEPTKNTKTSDLRDFSITKCPALDFFVCSDVRATSCSNDSFVYASSFVELTKKLDAKLLWTRSGNFTDFTFMDSGNWVFETSSVDVVHFAMTTLPDTYIGEQSWFHKIKAVETEGLPIRPFIGDTLQKAVTQIIDVARKMVFQAKDLGQRGSATSGWTVSLQSEYDCQNLFFTVIKPWIPQLGREEVAISVDGQQKISDFSLFQSKLIVEMKFVDSNSKKREVIKTLDGLSRFYTQNSNIGCLLMIIYVKEGVTLDAAKWEADYTFAARTPSVITVVISVP